MKTLSLSGTGCQWEIRPRGPSTPARPHNSAPVTRTALAAALLAGALGVSCRRAPPRPGPSTVRFAHGTPVLSLDPTLSEGTTWSALSNVFEPLVTYDPMLQLAPALAVRWTTPDETTWVFSLRPGVALHDGTVLDAATVAAALERARSDADSTVRGSLWAVSRIEATGPLEVTLRTSVPDALLLHELTLVLVARGATRAAIEAHPVGTGPYRVALWDRPLRSRPSGLPRSRRGKTPSRRWRAVRPRWPSSPLRRRGRSLPQGSASSPRPACRRTTSG